ncbi:endodeoxyribonuclease RusA [Pseudomonas syringae group genomosp. 7]|uniref:endodeoxyribonuclease RusA n=1 Tax=Pseudomonas syringae group genomosp. 7 TaxID=251699 RepID=UPI000F0074A9|nr:endodeoxyribonuclease RusA [Pseudomonas syringae group genomosp. 7]
MIDLMLPWPPKVLSPNARTHWATKSRAAKAYRNTCYLLCLQAALPVPEGRALLSLEFIPPDRRRGDDDNCIAAFKSGRDGVAQALGIDDSKFVTQLQISTETIKGGAVLVRITDYIEVSA